jgi:hypothetical protein
MLHALASWARRNTRRALALAVAPGLAMLAVDAAIGHFAGSDFDNRLQLIPVLYGMLGFVVLPIVVWPKAHAPFAWAARVLGAAGVAVGLTRTWFHFTALGSELKGDYSWPAIEGGLSVAPPAFAPLGFAAVGVLLWLLPSPRLLLRLRIGRRRESVVRALGGPRRGSPETPPGSRRASR